MKNNDKFQQYKLSKYINKEDIVDLAYEFDLSEYIISKKLKKNIKEQALKELHLKPRIKPKSMFKVSVAALLAVTSIFIATTPSALASIKSVIRYIPGFSTLLQDDPSTTARYVLEQPVEKVIGSKKIEITGMTADNKSASFYLTFYDNAFRFDDYEQDKVSVDNARENFIHSITIKDAMGNKLKKSTSSCGIGGGQLIGRFTYTGNIKNPQSLQISFENDEKSSINLKLIKAKDYNSYTELGPSYNKNGVSIIAVAKNINDNINVKLFTPLESTYSVTSYGIEKCLLSASDDAGNNYEISSDLANRLGCSINEFNIANKNSNAKSLTVTIPEILLRYDKPTQETKIEVDIPEKSSMDLNKKIVIQGHTIFLKKIEKIENNRIRLYWDMNISDKDNEYITAFCLGDIYSSKYYYDTNSFPYSVMQTTDISYNPGEKTKVVNVSNIEIAKKGPWKIKIDK